MLKTAIAHSIELDVPDAIEDVLRQSHKQLGNLKPQAGLLFTGIDLDYPLILTRINEAYPGIALIGCTAFSELSSVHGVVEDSICLVLFCSDTIVFKAGIAEKISENPTEKLKKAVEKTKKSMVQNPELCIVTPSCHSYDGKVTNFLNMLDVIIGMKQGLGETFPIFGGAGGNRNWQGDFEFYNQRIYRDAASFLLISGPIMYSLGVESGWMPIGKRTTVTRADKNMIYQIGDLTALDFYKHYLGEFDFMGVVEYPLAIFEKEEDSFYLMAPTLFDSEKGCMIFQTPIPEGSTVQLAHTTRDSAIEAVKLSVKKAISEYPGAQPSIALCFTCMARRIVLQTRVQEEFQVIKDNFPGLPAAGFYTGGEIGPLGRGKSARHHNETFLTLLLGVE